MCMLGLGEDLGGDKNWSQKWSLSWCIYFIGRCLQAVVL